MKQVSGPAKQDEELLLQAGIIERLCTEALRAGDEECCGLLLGGDAVTEVRPAANVADNRRTHFEIDPAALIEAFRDEREGGASVLGYYHSHPRGPAEPSATDRAMASGDGKVWAIVAEGDVRFWRDDEHGFSALSYSVLEV